MRIFFIAIKLNFNKGGSMVENNLTARTLQSLGNDVTMLTLFSELNNVEHVSYNVIEEFIPSKRQLSILYHTVRLMKKYSSETDVFYIEGQTFFYGAGFYRWIGGPRPVVAFFVREQVSWPENISGFLPNLDRQKSSIRSLFYSLKRAIRWYVERYILIYFANFVDFFTWGSPLLQEEYEVFGLRTKKKSITIGDPYPFDEVMKKYGILENTYSDRIKKSGEKIILFYSSRMAPGKGFDVLIKAFAQLKNKERFALVLGGDGSERPFIAQMVKDLELEQYVSVPGWIPKETFHQSLANADIFIHPRWRTAQPSLGLSEAMAFGIPSIVPRNTGLHWVAGESALTFTLDDIDDLADKIEQLGSNNALRNELSQKCYTRLKKPDVNYQKTIPAIHEIMTGLVKKASTR